jgi:hypothetical protein
MNMFESIYEQLLSITWPDEFVVIYSDGRSERLLKGEGVIIMLPADDPDGVGGISADLPMKHPRNQKKGGRYISFTDLKALKSINGGLIWTRVDPI